MSVQPAGDLPQITTSNYGQFTAWTPIATSDFPMQYLYDPSPAAILSEEAEQQRVVDSLARERLARERRRSEKQQAQQPPHKPEEQEPTMSSRRIVQVFIADPNENVPLESALLHRGEVQFTDATDQELYFDIPIVDLLKTHNEKRKTWLDKEASRKSSREVFLESAKIRDLRMVVVNIATF